MFEKSLTYSDSNDVCIKETFFGTYYFICNETKNVADGFIIFH